MSRRELGFLVSRVMAVVGLYWVIAGVGKFVGTVTILAQMIPRYSDARDLYLYGGVDLFWVLAVLFIVSFLWFRAGRFGQGSDEGQALIQVDPHSIKSNLIFGVGLFYLVGGLTSLIGMGTAAALNSKMPSSPVLTYSWASFLEGGAKGIVGLLLVMGSSRPRWMQTLGSLARADYGEGEED